MSNQKIPLSEMIQTLREELEAAQKESTKSNLKFETESVELELSVEVSKTASGKGGVKFWVIEAGGEYESQKSSTHKFKVVLKPKSKDTNGSFDVSDESYSKASDT